MKIKFVTEFSIKEGLKMFVLIPTISYLKDSFGWSINITWLCFDLSFNF